MEGSFVNEFEPFPYTCPFKDSELVLIFIHSLDCLLLEVVRYLRCMTKFLGSGLPRCGVRAKGTIKGMTLCVVSQW